MNTTTYEYANVSPDKLAHGYRWLNEKWNEEICCTIQKMEAGVLWER
jgi:hypothetical protein